METLLSTFGNALLLVQEQMRASVTRFGDDDFAPNFYHVLLSGVSFSEEDDPDAAAAESTHTLEDPSPGSEQSEDEEEEEDRKGYGEESLHR